MPTFDLSTKVVDLETSIWVVHPGRSRRFFNHFYEHNVLFLELPGLNISLEALRKTETVRRHIRMSLAFIEYYGGRSREGKKVPSADPRSYDGSAGDGQLASLVGSARKLFAVAKKGDLVIVPGKGGSSGPALIGEIASDFDPSSVYRVRPFEYADVQTRAVKWIRTDLNRRDLPLHLDAYLSKPPAMRQVPRGDGDGFFGYAYKSYVLGDTSAAQIEGPNYSGKNPLDTYPAARLISYLVAGFAALELGAGDDFGSLDIDSAINRYYDPRLIASVGQNFNSPGAFSVVASTAGLAVALTLFTAVLSSDFTGQELLSGITVENSATEAADETAAIAEHQVNQLLNAMGRERLEEAKKLADEAHDKIGLRTPVKPVR